MKFVGALSRGQSVDADSVATSLVMFNKENPETAIKELRAHVVNTIKRAKNYEGSVIQKQIEEVRGSYSNEAKAEPKPDYKVVSDQDGSDVKKKDAPKKAPVLDDDFDPDIPF